MSCKKKISSANNPSVTLTRTALMSCLLPSKCCCSEFCIQNFNFRTSAQELQCWFVKLWVRHLCVGNACWTFNFRAPGSKLVLPSLKSGHFASELLIMKFCLGPWRCIFLVSEFLLQEGSRCSTDAHSAGVRRTAGRSRLMTC